MRKGTIADFSNAVKIQVSAPREDIEKIVRVLKPLEEEMEFNRGKVIIELRDDALNMVGLAKDLTSLRSLCNGLLKCLYLTLHIFYKFKEH